MFLQFQKAVRLFIFIICLGIITWQCCKCIQKYLAKPQETRLSVVNSAGKMFPSVTVCPDAFNDTAVYNNSNLSQCGINSYDYRYGCIWSVKGVNEECSDPKVLFEKVMLKLGDLLVTVDVSLYNQNQYSKVTVWPNDTGQW